MVKLIDLTGQRFGRLVVLRRAENRRGRVFWLCHCDCGNEREIASSALLCGGTISCGCHRNQNRYGNDLTGKRFGRLTVLRQAGRKGKELTWLCRCDCGNEIETTRLSLVTGGCQSCGCLHNEQAKIHREKNYFAGTNIGVIKSKKARVDSHTGARGVTFHRQSGKYWARITVQGKQHSLGLYATLEEAAAARRRAEKEYFAPILEEYDKQRK